MGCSTGSQKITLQIISGIYLAAAVVAVIMGIFLIGNANEVSNAVSKSLTTDRKTATAATNFVGWYCIIVGIVIGSFSIFGIYNVAKENGGKVKAYAIYLLALVILNIMGLVTRPSGGVFLNIIVLSAAAFLSLSLAEDFKNKLPRSINSV